MTCAPSPDRDFSVNQDTAALWQKPGGRERMHISGLKMLVSTPGTMVWLQLKFKIEPKSRVGEPDVLPSWVRTAGSGLGWS